MALYYYFEPQVKNVSVIRCNSSGKADDGGTYLKISATRDFCPFYQTSPGTAEVISNKCEIRYRYRMLPDGAYSAWTTILASSVTHTNEVTTDAMNVGLVSGESYEVIVGVKDDVGEANTSIVLTAGDVFMHRDGEKNSIGIGEAVAEENTVSIAAKMSVKLKGLLSVAKEVLVGSGKFSSTNVDMHEEGYFGNFYMSLPKNAEYLATAYLAHPYGGQLIANCGAGRVALTGLTAPVDASDAANKEYVDAGLADKYSPTNKPTPDAIGAMSMDLLWENASKSSSFAGQKISVSVNAYDYLMIVAGYNTGENNGSTVTFIRMRPYGVGETSYCITVDYFTSSNTLTRPYRKLTIPSGRGSITFGDGYKQDGTASNSNVIPYYIYGVKGVTN